MRSIVSIDFNDHSCNGVVRFNTGTNELILSLVPLSSQLNNITVYVYDYTNTLRTLEYNALHHVTVPIEYWNGDGTIQVYLQSEEGLSSQVTLFTKAFTSNNDVYVCYEDGVYTLKTCTNKSALMLKQYSEKITTDSPTSSITFKMDHYSTDVINMYVNRFKLIENEDYSIFGNTVTFTKELDAESVVEIVMYRIE